jgi:23S rRNA pseudouridine1911/1915/1917 synthase
MSSKNKQLQPIMAGDWLKQKFPTAKITTLRRILAAGRLRINGLAAVRMNQPIKPDDRVVLHGEGRSKPMQRLSDAPAADLHIVYEDADVLAINKPAGLLTSTNARERRPTLAAQVRDYLAKTSPKARVGLIHRLDRDAAGLLIFAKTQDALASLKRQFANHTVVRQYTAIVQGRPIPDHGTIDNRLLERADGSVRVTENPSQGERAVTGYEILKAGDQSALRVTLATGRKHQIRAQLAHRGWPVVGDVMYGVAREGGPKKRDRGPVKRKSSNPTVKLLLAAVRLDFDHPRTGKRIVLRIPEPDYFNFRSPESGE